jgi:hypothetical protein
MGMGKKKDTDSRDIFEKALDVAVDNPMVTIPIAGALLGRALGSRVRRLKGDTKQSYADTKRFAKNFGGVTGGMGGIIVGLGAEGGRREEVRRRRK